MAFPFTPFAFRKQQPAQEALGDKKAIVPHLNSVADLPAPPRSKETTQARTVAAGKAAQVVKKAPGIRKMRSSKRKKKNNKHRG